MAALDAQPPDTAGALAGLRATLDEVSGRARPRTGGEPEAELARVLSRREFLPERPGPLEALWPRIADWLRSLLGDRNLPRGPSRDEAAPWLAGAAGLAALAVGLYVALSLRRTVAAASARLAPAAPARPAAADLFARAASLAGAGEYREAARHLYLATMFRGEELGRLRFDRALTNRELLARAREGGGPELVERLRPLVERFDRFWYGGALGSAAEYEALARLSAGAWPEAA